LKPDTLKLEDSKRVILKREILKLSLLRLFTELLPEPSAPTPSWFAHADKSESYSDSNSSYSDDEC
jgi:hypothetical protein